MFSTGAFESSQAGASGENPETAGIQAEATVSPEEIKDLFRATLQEPLNQAARLGDADIVVGIPFFNEADTIGEVLRVAGQGLREYFPSKRCVIVAVGGTVGGEALEVVNAAPGIDGISRIAFLLEHELTNGKGWGLWAIMEVARALGANLAIIEADLRSRHRNDDIEGLVPEWIRLLLEPIEKRAMDLVVSRFNRHYLEAPIASHVFHPLFTAIYDCPIHDLAGGQWGISYRLLRTFLQKSPYPPSDEVGGYGIDSWLAATAISSDARICEAKLGIKIHRPSLAKAELVLTQAVRVLFAQVLADHDRWEKAETASESLVQTLPTFGTRKPHQPDEVVIIPRHLVDRFKQGFSRFQALYQWVLPDDYYRQLEVLADTEAGSFRFPHRLWAQVVYHLWLALAFTRDFAQGDLISALVTAYSGHLAGFVQEMMALRDRLNSIDADEAERLVSLEAEREVELMVDEFVRLKPDFIAAWESHREALRPPVPNVTYREFVPGVPLVVPSEVTAPDGSTVAANSVYEFVFHRYKQQFEEFVYQKLNVPRGAGSGEIVSRIKAFMIQVEAELDETIIPWNLATIAGVQEAADLVFRFFQRTEGHALAPEMATWLLWRYPPTNLITRLGHSYLNELLTRYEPNDILALASWTEEYDYTEQVGALIRESVRPEHFVRCLLKPLVVDIDEFPSLAEMKESPSLSRIAGRLVLSNLHKGMGGEFPRLRYLTTIAKSVIEAERFGEVWQQFTEERKDFAEKVVNALEGHWGKTPLSAHNIFENGHERVFVERLREMARQIVREAPGDNARASLAGHLDDVADSYHLALTLPDGTFVPCSAWSWASYSFKGGTGLPTPLSLHVERDWSSRDFLTEYFKAAGGDEGTIENRIRELMAQGREYEDLAPLLLGEIQGAGTVVKRGIPTEEQPPARPLARFAGNPVLRPIREHYWESRFLLNPGAIRLNGRVYIVYRAFGDDDISRLGMAVSEDGFAFTERLDEPIFEPITPSEEKGCEDPRLTLIDGRVYMLYTAYSGTVAQIAAASISVEDFVDYRWKSWHRHGLVFPGFTDKDAALFPEQLDGKYVMLHRVDPHIWITFSTHLRCPWPRKEHTILAGSRPGMVWDSLKIGGGAQPIKTEYGWLLIYHGVDHDHVYRLGVMLVDLADPTVLLYRSPNFILEPTERFEVGEKDESWVPNVVFTCGAVSRDVGKDILTARDEVLVYYGAADSVIGVATARIEDLVPEEFR